jgi:hypothetical protein
MPYINHLKILLSLLDFSEFMLLRQFNNASFSILEQPNNEQITFIISYVSLELKFEKYLIFNFSIN